jgi:hypothetical protein
VAREREMLTRTPSGVRQPGTVPVKAYNPWEGGVLNHWHPVEQLDNLWLSLL